MMEVKSIAVSRLSKAEVQVLLEDVILILKKHNLEALRLQDLNDILVGQAAKIQFFTVPYGAHPLTHWLEILRKERLDCASFIAMQVRSFEKSTFKNFKENAMIAKRLSKPFLHYLGQKGQFKVGEFISTFFINLDGTPEAQEAYASLGLKPYVEELRRLNKEYSDVYTERALDKKNRPPTGNRALERETQRRLRQFFEQVNSSQGIFTDIDYSSLISQLNTTLAVYSKSINTRIATNKRRARKKKDAEEKLATEKVSSESKVEIKAATTSEEKHATDGEVVVDSNESNRDHGKEMPKPATTKNGAKGNVVHAKKVKRVLKRGGRGKR